MSNAQVVLQFIETLEGKDVSGLSLVLKMFEFVDENEQMKEFVGVQDKLSVVRNILQATIKQLFTGDQQDEYLLLVSHLFSDTQDLGTLVTLIMKAVEELNKMKKMSGPEKKKLAKSVFDHLIDYSPLDEAEKQLARYAFGGIVEAIIWAKHGGLKETKKRCSVLCK